MKRMLIKGGVFALFERQMRPDLLFTPLSAHITLAGGITEVLRRYIVCRFTDS